MSGKGVLLILLFSIVGCSSNYQKVCASLEKRVKELEVVHKQSICKHGSYYYVETSDTLIFYGVKVPAWTRYYKKCKLCDKTIKQFDNKKGYLLDQIANLDSEYCAGINSMPTKCDVGDVFEDDDGAVWVLLDKVRKIYYHR